MGYETKLIIGKSYSTSNEYATGEPEIDGSDVYFPLLKDSYGNFIGTGRKETYFSVFATIDLCKCGYGSKVNALDRFNKDKFHFWYYYEGNKKVTEDCYGDKPKPLPVKTVLDALKKDSKENDYRRFKWAVSLLESMADDSEDLEVLFYHH